MDSRLWSSYTLKLSPLLAVWGARQVVCEQDEGGDRGKAFRTCVLLVLHSLHLRHHVVRLIRGKCCSLCLRTLPTASVQCKE